MATVEFLGVKSVLPCAGMWYYLSLFYCDKDLGMAYSWVSVGTAFSQVTQRLATHPPSLPGLVCAQVMSFQAASSWAGMYSPGVPPSLREITHALCHGLQVVGVWGCMQVIGSPLAAGLLSLDGIWGLKGWQWLFVVEGLPTVVLGMYIHNILVDGPAKAAFLTAEERETVINRQEPNPQVVLPPYLT